MVTLEKTNFAHEDRVELHHSSCSGGLAEMNGGLSTAPCYQSIGNRPFYDIPLNISHNNRETDLSGALIPLKTVMVQARQAK